MQEETIKRFIGKLDGMIAAIDQALVLGGRTEKEREAGELLKDARLKLIEDLEDRGAPGYELPKSTKGSRGVFIAGQTVIPYGE